jgi:hypothetical protein
MAVRSDTLRRYTLSATALAHGINNTPTDPDVIQRLLWMATQEPLILSVLREAEPLAHVTSAYRCAELNQAVGGVASSFHPFGLALDFGGLVNEASAYQYLWGNRQRLPGSLRLVYVESDHIHVEFFDPLGKVGGPSTETRWASQE